MAEFMEQPTLTEAPPETDILAAVRKVLAGSDEPLTLSKIRASLPVSLRSLDLEQLAEALRRQVSAEVLHQYPKYRSQQDRFWDRPMGVHLVCLVRGLVEEKALPWSDIRRKLPDYAKTLAESVLENSVTKGDLHRHPPLSARTGPRFGVQPPNPKEFLDGEFSKLFIKLQGLGFTLEQLRQGALEILHEEEWSPAEMPRPEERMAKNVEEKPAMADLEPQGNPQHSENMPEGMGSA